MPWVDQARCVSCGVCVETCPVGAIALDAAEKAAIDESGCIRCGACHGACPQEAVRHDSERIPLEVEQNVQWVTRLLRHYESAGDRRASLERMNRYFCRQRKVADATIGRIEAIR